MHVNCVRLEIHVWTVLIMTGKATHAKVMVDVEQKGVGLYAKSSNFINPSRDLHDAYGVR